MAKHQVILPAPLRPLLGGQTAVWSEGNTVGEVLANLATDHPALRSRLFDGTQIRRSLMVVVGGSDIRSLAGTATVLSEGAAIRLLLAFTSG
jgi:molybdopterin converting factor small subunit